MVIKRKYLIISLIVIALVGSFLNFYCTNLVMNAISNKGAPGFFAGLLMPITALIIAIEFVVGAFFAVRIYLHPTHLKRMMFVYSIILMSLSFVGIITDILSGIIVYGSMIKPYPFGGALIIFLFWHLAVICLGFASIFIFRKKVEYDDIFIHKTEAKYVIQTIITSLIVFYAFNRFGAFLWAPVYAQFRTLDVTYPFYILISLPMAMLVVDMFYIFRIFKSKHRNIGVMIAGICMGLSIFIITQFAVRSSKDQSFLAAISPAVPIERLITVPIDSILNSLTVVFISIYTILNSVKFKKMKDKELIIFKEMRKELDK